MAILKGPFLNFWETGSIEIRWEVDAPDEVYTIEIAPPVTPIPSIEPESFTGLDSSPDAIYICSVTISGLSPGTIYTYTISDSTSPEVSFGTFKTVPNGPVPFRFAVYGDNRDEDHGDENHGDAPKKHQYIIDEINAENQIAFIANVGDMVNDGKVYDDWAPEFFDQAESFLPNIPFVPVFGNHERDGLGNTKWFDYFFNWLGKRAPKDVTHRCYAFTYGCARIIVLDSDLRDYGDGGGETRGADVLEFLIEEEFETSEFENAIWKIAIFHHPPFTSTDYHPGYNDGVNTYLVNNLMPVLRDKGIRLIFNGHAHLYEHYIYPESPGTENIHCVTSGGGGAELYDFDPSDDLQSDDYRVLRDSINQYCVIDVEPWKLTVTTKGGVLDVNGSASPDADDWDENVETIEITRDRVSVSTVLVIDRSGSMGETSGPTTRIEAAIAAADLYIDLLHDGDEISIVRFNVSAEEIFERQTTDADGKTAAQNFLSDAATNMDRLQPSGRTSIGQGIVVGSDVLSGVDDNARAMIVLTDGRQNEGTAIDTGIVHFSLLPPPAKAYAVGFDIGTEEILENLRDITSAPDDTGHVAITGELSGENEFLLQKLYVQILADASGEVIVADPYFVLKPGEKRHTEINIGETETGADFILLFREYGGFPENVQFWLEDPNGTNGTIIEPNNVGGLPNVIFTAHRGHMFFRFQFPVFPDDLTAQYGTWKAWVKNISQDDIRHDRMSASINRDLLYCTVICKANSDLKLDANLKQKDSKPGSAINIILKSDLYGKPVTFTSPPTIDVTKPDGKKLTLDSKTHNVGVCSATLRDTTQTGRYLVTCEVEMKTPMGYKGSRYRILSGVILKPECDCCERITTFFRCLIKFFTHCLWKGKLFSFEKKC